jgi:DNA-binding XRE family transcriptional regulator
MKSQALFQDICERIQAGVKLKERPGMGRQIREFRLSLGLTPTQFAQKLSVSPQSVHRWEKGDALPRLAQAHKFEQLFKYGTEQTTQHSQAKVADGLVEIEGRKIAIRSWSYLIERQRDAAEVWILKCNREFLAGWDGPTRRQIIFNLEKNEKLVYRYFYCHPANPGDSGDNLAKESFDIFRGDLERDYPSIKDRVEGYRIDAEEGEPGKREERLKDMIELGLTPTYATWIVIVYNDDARKEIHRTIDIFAELPAATYAEFPGSSGESPEMMLSDDEYLVWFELPQRRADKLWRQWKKLFDKHGAEWRRKSKEKANEHR